jgi:hypothetical protein
MRDSMDIFFSSGSEMLYEYTTGSLNDYNVRFSYSAMNHVRNADYTESCVDSVDFFPLFKEEIIKKGYNWREPEEKNYNITKKGVDIPDSIEDVDEKILNEVLGCIHERKCSHQCTTAFRLTQDELNFYKKHNIPIPNKCPNCRYSERFSKLPPPKLWHRKCMKEGCQNEFETSYAPDRLEIVYCERCYQQEVY